MPRLSKKFLAETSNVSRVHKSPFLKSHVFKSSLFALFVWNKVLCVLYQIKFPNLSYNLQKTACR